MNADGSDQRQLASVGCWGHFLLWTSDSRAVVFRGERGSQACRSSGWISPAEACDAAARRS